jgi:hypothetical protein
VLSESYYERIRRKSSLAKERSGKPPRPAPVFSLQGVDISASPTSALARQLAGLGYPGFAHLRGRKANPAAVLLEALVQEDLEVRLAEALPWVVLTYPDMDWPWLIREVKLRDVQNRLGFVVAMTRDLAATRARFRPALERLPR